MILLLWKHFQIRDCLIRVFGNGLAADKEILTIALFKLTLGRIIAILRAKQEKIRRIDEKRQRRKVKIES